MNKYTALTSFLLFVLLVVLFVIDFQVQKQTELLVLRPTNISFLSTSYPVLTSGLTPGGDVSAQSFAILDKNSGVTIFAKNKTLQLPLASTTKIMTALVALEHYALSDQLVIKNDDIEGTVIGLNKGEIVSFPDLLYGMLLSSGNDAAMAIADNYPGGKNAFVAKMNEKAHELSLGSMQFVDPAGLEDDGDYATSSDLGKLAAIALENKIFAEIVETKFRTIQTINTGNKYVLTNLNKLLGENGIIGVKTGHTEKAGDVLVTAKVENGRTIIIALMKSNDRFADTKSLLGEIDGQISYLTFQP